MIDSLLVSLKQASELSLTKDLGLARGKYVLATFHRPSNVDDRTQLEEILSALRTISTNYPVLFPMHPRTKERISAFGLQTGSIQVMDPLGYVESLHLQDGAALVITDSGGLQEETTVLGVPCLTLRDSTERPITVTEGTNELIPVRTTQRILEAFERGVAKPRVPRRPEGWDGRTAERIAQVFKDSIG